METKELNIIAKTKNNFYNMLILIQCVFTINYLLRLHYTVDYNKY